VKHLSKFWPAAGCCVLVVACLAANPSRQFSNVPASYLEEPEHIPDFWVSTVDAVNAFLDKRVRTGEVVTIGTSAGGRPIRAVFYGKPRRANGTTTFSGSLGFGDVRAFLGPDYSKKVYMAMAGVHGGEFEGIVGMVNLISVMETSKDLRGTSWSSILESALSLDRIILIPIVNPDGRARVPLRMERFRGEDETVAEYFNTGGRLDGKNIGWPQCKEFIPLDFSKTQFPGGYPNDAGVNIQHDDFLGRRQPETEALLQLVARERPDLILNMHTGAVFPLMHRPFAERELMPVYEELFRRVHTQLTAWNFQKTRDPVIEADPKKGSSSPYNLDTALNLQCGALSVVIESPSHAFSTAKRDGKLVIFTPEQLLDIQLLCHMEAIKFLVETGGRARWTPPARR
jgi:hypothetical protein